MIFDFISGEASTQEGGEKFAKWLAEDTDLTQKEKKSVVEKIKDFFNALDNAIDNRQRMLGGGTASKADLRDDIRYSKQQSSKR